MKSATMQIWHVVVTTDGAHEIRRLDDTVVARYRVLSIDDDDVADSTHILRVLVTEHNEVARTWEEAGRGQT